VHRGKHIREEVSTKKQRRRKIRTGSRSETTGEQRWEQARRVERIDVRAEVRPEVGAEHMDAEVIRDYNTRKIADKRIS
jgi:hypothetical protein